ncbi:hypothetical protein BU14_0412s0009 [Porphyra umbilicalis]|uniref:CHRD domain-containing protein n=1 Tax=Porphyra umbilicalis TaxID=2786 RepID=A0A1X6NVY0_PORUM|nr:hypothetical protein BU14_0412s0009 [Porphyra umbilicalis]|eukprot:OSX72715.1 hypothetical protein BU14_0412s0009 [Porphyra umbilicalis]
MSFTKLAAAAVATLAVAATSVSKASAAHAGNYIGYLSGHQMVPPVNAAGTGTVKASLDSETKTLAVSFHFRGLAKGVKGLGLYAVWAGRNGEEQFSLASVTEFGHGHTDGKGHTVLTLSERQVALLEAREFYLMVGSELRGQLVPSVKGAKTMSASLSSAFTNPPTTSTAFGGIVVELMPTGDMVVTGSWQGLSSPLALNLANGNHFHVGLTGTNGQRIFELQPTMSDNNTTAFYTADKNTYKPTSEFLDMMAARGVYMDVHSELLPTGELRGQVLSAASSSAYTTLLLPASVNPPAVGSDATGGLSVEYFFPSTIAVTGSFAQLSSPVAEDLAMGTHLHVGPADGAGPRIQELVATKRDGNTAGDFVLDDNVFLINSTNQKNLLSWLVYCDIHTDQFRGGELRGQLSPAV